MGCSIAHQSGRDSWTRTALCEKSETHPWLGSKNGHRCRRQHLLCRWHSPESDSSPGRKCCQLCQWPDHLQCAQRSDTGWNVRHQGRITDWMTNLSAKYNEGLAADHLASGDLKPAHRSTIGRISSTTRFLTHLSCLAQVFSAKHGTSSRVETTYGQTYLPAEHRSDQTNDYSPQTAYMGRFTLPDK